MTLAIATQESVVDAQVVPDHDTVANGTARLSEAAKHFRDSHNELTGLVRLAYVESWYVEEFDFSQSGWEAYLSKYIGPAFNGIKGVERVRLVAGFTAIGMSTRIQAAVLGVGKSTIERDQEKSSGPDGTQDEPHTPTKGSDGRIIDKENPKRFSCKECGKRKSFDERNEIDGANYCNACADAYDSLPPEPVATTQKPKQPRRTKAQIRIEQLQRDVWTSAGELPWNLKQATNILKMTTEIATLMEAENSK